MEQQPNPTPAPPAAPAAAPQPQPEQQLPGAPATWPGATGAYKYSKVAVKYNLSTLVWLYVIDIVVALVLDTLLRSPITSLVVDVLSIFFSIAITLTFIAGVRRAKLSPSQALEASPPLFFKFFGLSLLIALSLGLSFLLLVIPFFFVFPRLVLAPYFLVDKKLGVMDAYKASWDNTKGHVGKVYGIVGLSIAMGLLAITIIGIPFAIYFLIMYSAAGVVLYEFINKKGPAAASQPAPQSSPTAQ